LIDQTTKTWKEQLVHYLFDPHTAFSILNTPFFPQVTTNALICKGEKNGKYSVVALIVFALKIPETHLTYDVWVIGTRYGTSKLPRRIRILFGGCAVDVFLHVCAFLVEELIVPLSVLFVAKMVKIPCMHCLCAPRQLMCGVTMVCGM